MSLESYILDIIEDRKIAPGFSKVLYLASQFYKAGSIMRNFLYEKKLIKTHAVPACVVSVGNIVCGGTGKTPFIQYLACRLAHSTSTAIITRGYRSKLEKIRKSCQISTGQGPIYSAEECGDESYWLACNTPCSVFVGKIKKESAILASKNKNKIILIDDGMQHRSLRRDVEIVLMNGTDLWGKGNFLPRGLLRDSPNRIAKADLIIINNCESDEQWKQIINEIKKYSRAPIIRSHRRYHFAKEVTEGLVGVFCGIAHPSFFEEAVIACGKKVVASLFSPDHKLPLKKSLEEFAISCKEKGANALICTEKDYVKLQKDLKLVIPVVPLILTLDFSEGKEALEDCIENILRKGRSFSID